MNDTTREALAAELLDRIERALNRHIDGGAARRIPVDFTDSDMVLADLKRARSALGGAAAPAPANVVPKVRCVLVENAALQMVRNALKNDAEAGRVVRGEILEELDAATHDLRDVATPAAVPVQPVAWSCHHEAELGAKMKCAQWCGHRKECPASFASLEAEMAEVKNMTEPELDAALRAEGIDPEEAVAAVAAVQQGREALSKAEELGRIIDHKLATYGDDQEFEPELVAAADAAIDRLASPPQERAQPTEQDSTCPNCGGSGTVDAPSDAGPDAYAVSEDCPHCNGQGTLLDAYNGVLTLFHRQYAQYIEACGVIAWKKGPNIPVEQLRHIAEQLDPSVNDAGQRLEWGQNRLRFLADAIEAAPAASLLPAQAPAVPLTDEQLDDMREDAIHAGLTRPDSCWWIDFARAIEAAHGIGSASTSEKEPNNG